MTDAPKPNDIYEDDNGCIWTVVGVHDRPSVLLENKAGDRIVPALDSPMFRGMRSRSSSPEPTARVEPPEEFKHLDFHWLENIEEEPGEDVAPFEWNSVFRTWYAHGYEGPLSADDAVESWRYLAPCIPPGPKADTQPVPVQQEITDTLLLQLRSIALTRDPEVYLTDARKVVGK